MLRIVLPGVVGAAIGDIRVSVYVRIAPVDVCIAVGIVDEVVVVLDVDIVVAAPSAAVPPATTKGCSHGHADAERDRHTRRIIAGRWIGNRRIRIRGGSVYNSRIVARNVDNFRAGLLHHNHLLAFDHLGFDLLLLRGFQIPVVFGFLAHALHCVHYVALLGKKCIPQIGGPLDVIVQILHDVRKCCQ